MTISPHTWAVVLLLAAPLPVSAQPVSGVFIAGGPILNNDMSWGGDRVRNVGLSIGGGLTIGRRTEVGVLVEVPPATTITDTADYYGGSPPRLVQRATYEIRARNRTVAFVVTRLP